MVIARGKHLFPFRTEQLSLSAPMVLGPQGPGRVGRRRFTFTSRLRAARGRCGADGAVGFAPAGARSDGAVRERAGVGARARDGDARTPGCPPGASAPRAGRRSAGDARIACARPGAVVSTGELFRLCLKLRVGEQQEVACDGSGPVHGALCGARGLSRRRRETRVAAAGGCASQAPGIRHRGTAAVSA